MTECRLPEMLSSNTIPKPMMRKQGQVRLSAIQLLLLDVKVNEICGCSSRQATTAALLIQLETTTQQRKLIGIARWTS